MTDKPKRSVRDMVFPPQEEPRPRIGETLEQFSQRPLTPSEKLGAALRVINDPELTPEEKLRLEKRILKSDDAGSKENASSSSEPSAASPATRSGSATSSPEASWTPDPPRMRVETGDDQAFVQETALRFLTILDTAMRDLAEMQKAITQATADTKMESIAIQQQMVLYEAARTVAMQLHMIAEVPVPELEMPMMDLINLDGKRLRKARKPNA
jgi:hypothetical protein